MLRQVTHPLGTAIGFLWGPLPINAVQHVFGDGWFLPFRAITARGRPGRAGGDRAFLGDVLSGALIGLGLVLADHRLWPHALTWLERQPFRWFAIAGAVAIVGAGAALPFVHTSRTAAALGGAAGAVLAALIEARSIGCVPTAAPTTTQALKIALGLAGLALLLAAHLLVPRTPLPEAGMYALAALWAVLGASALFVRLGLAQVDRERASSQ